MQVDSKKFILEGGGGFVFDPWKKNRKKKVILG